MGNMSRLKDGSEVPTAVVNAVMSDLRTLFFTNAPATLALIEKCRGSDRGLDVTESFYLCRCGFLDRAERVKDEVRHVIVSAVSGEDDALRIDSPIASA